MVNFLHTTPLKNGTKLKDSIKLKGKVKTGEGEKQTFRKGQMIKIESFTKSTATNDKNLTILLGDLDLFVNNENEDFIPNERKLSLEKSKISLKRENQNKHHIEITTFAGEIYKISKDSELEQLLLLIVNWQVSNEVRCFRLYAF